MPVITFENTQYIPAENESVLDCLLRHGLDLPHGCKEGACQSCMMHANVGSPTSASQSGLKESQKQNGFFLSCSCVPQEDMSIALEQAIPLTQAKVLSIDKLNASVMRLRLAKTFDYRPGQYLNIWHQTNVIRSYSIASEPSEDAFIELHIKHYTGGQFSHWAWELLQPGDELKVQGAMGDCFYTAHNPEQPMVLAGIGTGLAPLYGILRDAINLGHKGPMHLIIGGKSADQFYLQNELAELASAHEQVSVQFLAQSDGDIYQYVKEQFPSTKDHRIFLCGAASFVKKMKKQCFLAGANMKDISADAFLPSA